MAMIFDTNSEYSKIISERAREIAKTLDAIALDIYKKGHGVVRPEDIDSALTTVQKLLFAEDLKEEEVGKVFEILMNEHYSGVFFGSIQTTLGSNETSNDLSAEYSKMFEKFDKTAGINSRLCEVMKNAKANMVDIRNKGTGVDYTNIMTGTGAALGAGAVIGGIFMIATAAGTTAGTAGIALGIAMAGYGLVMMYRSYKTREWKKEIKKDLNESIAREDEEKIFNSAFKELQSSLSESIAEVINDKMVNKKAPSI